MLCKGCGRECQSQGTKEGPIELVCYSCEGNSKGCKVCNETGFVALEGCPKQICRGYGRIATLVDMLEKGVLPIAGGILDQSVWVMDAIQTLQRYEAEFKR